MLKKILLFMCFLVLLSGVGWAEAEVASEDDDEKVIRVTKAEVISEVDNFDGTKYIYSYIKLSGMKEKGIEIKELIFRKSITIDSVEYVLIFGNKGSALCPTYNNFLIKFDDDSEMYILPRMSDNNIYDGYKEAVLVVPQNIVDKILASDKITFKIPLDPNYKETSIRNFIIDVNEEIINAWRQVIQAQ